MRLKELHGLPVIDPTAARKIGTVADYQVDPVSGRLAALDVTGAENHGDERVVASRIRRVGRNAVILTGRGGAAAGSPPEINERWLDASSLVGLEVMGDDGDRIGSLTDATFDQDTLAIDAYMLKAAGWLRFTTTYGGRIQPDKVHACSRHIMIYSTGRVTESPEPAVIEESHAVTRRMPLKPEDQLPAPSYDDYDRTPDGQTVSTGRM